MLDIRNLSVRRGGREILTRLTLSLPCGSMTALIGRNGSGKSTLLSSIGGLLPYTGEVLFDAVPLVDLAPRERARRLALLPQTLASPHMTVRELVALGRHPWSTVISRPTDKDRDAVARAMQEADVFLLAERYLDEISGGERQRAYLAMILAQDAPLWLLDEPATYMDLAVSAHFMELLQKLKQEKGKTLLVAMHDVSSAIRYADHIALLDGGKLAFLGTTEECLSTDVIERTFSVRRINAGGETFFAG